MTWQVEYTDEFGDWWDMLSGEGRTRVTASVGLLERLGSNSPPHSSGISGSRHGHVRELRVQVGGRPLQVFNALDPRRAAILLIGGEDRTGRLLHAADSDCGPAV